MKKYKYALNVKDSSGQWKCSPEEDSFASLAKKYGEWIDAHPTVAFTIVKRIVFNKDEQA